MDGNTYPSIRSPHLRRRSHFSIQPVRNPDIPGQLFTDQIALIIESAAVCIRTHPASFIFQFPRIRQIFYQRVLAIISHRPSLLKIKGIHNINVIYFSVCRQGCIHDFLLCHILFSGGLHLLRSCTQHKCQHSKYSCISPAV